MKKINYLIVIIFLFIGIVNVSAIDNFDNTIKVYDYAQILTDKEENKLKDLANDYIENYNMDMVIVTVKYYSQTNVDEYVDLFYTKNNFGIGTNKDGIIVVIDLKEKQSAIKTFGNTSNYYSEYEINNILNIMNNKKSGFDILKSFIDNSDKYINNFDTDYKETSDLFLPINWYFILMPSIIIPTIVIILGILKNKNVKKQETANYYIKKDSIIINTKSDKFMTTNTKKERIKKD